MLLTGFRLGIRRHKLQAQRKAPYHRLHHAHAVLDADDEAGGPRRNRLGRIAERDIARLHAEMRGNFVATFSDRVEIAHEPTLALIAYASSWMKCHHPEVFCAAPLNAQPMGFYAPAQIVRDACEHGVEVRPVCVNASR